MAQETEETPKKGFDIKNLGTNAWIGIAIVCAIIGGIIGHFALGGGTGKAIGKTTLTEAELDTVVATYAYNGATESVTAREVIEHNSSLQAAADEEGNYTVPSADTIISHVRNAIIVKAAEAEGVTVSDDDLVAYAEETLGSSDFASIGTSYSMDEEMVKELLRESALMNALRDKIVGDEKYSMPDAPAVPEVPTKGEDGEELSEEARAAAQEEAYNAVSKDYADYIIALAGDEWDAKANGWKSEDGPYATALADYEVSNDGASYNAAEAAYYVAYEQYSTQQTDTQGKWTEYYNGILNNASINLNTLSA